MSDNKGLAVRIVDGDGDVLAVNADGSINAGGGGGGASTIADGADVAQGSTSDTSSATTVIGRLQKLVALLPASLGQKTKAASLAVTLASDQDALPASQSGTWTVQPGNTANSTAWKVDASSVAVPVTDNSGSLTVDQGTASNLNAQVVGTVAHDGVDAGNPVKVGGKAETTAPSAVSDADRVDAFFDEFGRLIVRNKARTGTTSSVADQATSTTLLALNELRLGASIVNESSSILYVKCGRPRRQRRTRSRWARWGRSAPTTRCRSATPGSSTASGPLTRRVGPHHGVDVNAGHHSPVTGAAAAP
jgi:hypothetical protein